MIRKAIIVVLTLAAAGTGVLWAWSFWDRYLPSAEFSVKHVGTVGTSLLPGKVELVWMFWPAAPLDCSASTDVGFLGARYTMMPTKFGSGRTCVATYGLRLPVWLLFVLFATYPTIAFIRGPLRRYRRRKGLCLKCGYNLTGNVTGVCPECGTEIEAA